jgi:hypothetical protein
VEFADGHIEANLANIIAEHTFEQLDQVGNIQRLVTEIVDNIILGNAIKSVDAFNKSGKEQRNTKGWLLPVEWRDGSESWEHLATMNEGYPIEMAKYVEANKVVSEPAFRWWVPFTLKRCERLLSKVNA